jgi:cytochrome c556
MRSLAALIVTLALGAACARPPAPAAASQTATTEAFVPGLGEIMSLQQMRHTKLWLAGQAGNWKLASYELDELAEGFDDVVRLHPTHKDSPVAPKDAIPRMVTGPLEDVRRAVEKQDAAGFTAAYDSLTAACNSCHEATNFGFNRVQRPATNSYPNQVFDAK